MKINDSFHQLVEYLDTAEVIFIMTSFTAEQEKGVARADILNKKLMSNLGIYPKSKKNPKMQYWFLLPSYDVATDFFQKLFEKVRLLLPKDSDTLWAKERLHFLESNGYIQVYIVPSYICSFHQVIFNPHGMRNMAAYSYSHSNDIMESLEWDSFSILEWKKNVYEYFQWENPKTKRPFTTEADALSFMKENPKYFAGYRCPLILNSRIN